MDDNASDNQNLIIGFARVFQLFAAVLMEFGFIRAYQLFIVGPLSFIYHLYILDILDWNTYWIFK